MAGVRHRTHLVRPNVQYPRFNDRRGFFDHGDKNGIVLGIGIAGANRSQESTYNSSLKTVHVGDRVRVSLLGSSELRRDALILLVVAVVGGLLPAWRAVRVRLLDAIMR